VRHRDPRAPQNLQPVGALERQLRHLLGPADYAARAVRDAVAQLRAPAPTTRCTNQHPDPRWMKTGVRERRDLARGPPRQRRPYTHRPRSALTDGSTPSSTRGFRVVLDDAAVVSLDEFVVTTQTLPDGTEFAHYGIVVEGQRDRRCGSVPDTRGSRPACQVSPPAPSTCRCCELSRTVAAACTGRGRVRATGLKRSSSTNDKAPPSASTSTTSRFTRTSTYERHQGGHVSSPASPAWRPRRRTRCLLYMLFETRGGRNCSARPVPAPARVFNVKGSLRQDRPNSAFAQAWTPPRSGTLSSAPTSLARSRRARTRCAPAADDTATPTVHPRGADLSCTGGRRGTSSARACCST
jgi:hypothetical protein